MKGLFSLLIVAVVFGVNAQTKDALSGIYTINNKTEAQAAKSGGPFGKITVVKLSDSKIAIKLRYSSGAPANHLGILSDTLELSNNQAIHVSKEDPTCKIIFDFTENEIKVTQNSGGHTFACGFGRNVYVDGIYKKTGALVQPAPFKLRTGAHNLTLQWISWDKPGKANITDLKNGTYKIEGEQINKEDPSEYLKISGVITPISKNELQFNGTILSRITYINKGKECKREGTQTFKAKPNKKYWRLENTINCEGGMVTDYIDIYF